MDGTSLHSKWLFELALHRSDSVRLVLLFIMTILSESADSLSAFALKSSELV